MTEHEFICCGYDCPREGINSCILKAGHEGQHNFWVQFKRSVSIFDERWQIVMHLDLKDSEPMEDLEVAATVEFLRLASSKS